MSFRWRTLHRRSTAIAVAAAGALAGLAAIPLTSSAAPNLSTLNSELGAQQARQQHLQNSLSGLSQLIGSLSGQISLVQSREAAVQTELAQDQAALASSEAALAREQHLLSILRARLHRAQTQLARQLVSSYESDRPDLVTVVLESNGFNDLLSKITYLRDAEHQQQSIIYVTRTAKRQADAAAVHLAALEASERQITANTATHARALAGMNSLLQAKRSQLSQAQAVQRAALSATRSHASQLQSEISHIEAQQAAQAAAQRAAAQSSSAPVYSSGPALGPSGGWAIPYPIVLCESGGQNLPPNSAGASGYYQIMPATWRGEGGPGPAAYLASKAEQDAIASRLWNGGAGASNWVCAGIVGIH
ncbi:MAG TPA: transglycosylase family protein [Solirubrobacteraceae bacterium]|nr:transglycosylase family protein [Solirubrobacteraceae bacterium]